MIGTEGARLLREKCVQGRPHRRKGAEEAPGPPTESECLEWKSTFERVCLQSEALFSRALFNITSLPSNIPKHGLHSLAQVRLNRRKIKQQLPFYQPS
ncbi:hypothetical protein CN689_27335 [Peribacillus butanolivorans]|uniref:Transposase n=1 Tax=Peribacillus butanolivorans TaxID=421767 RepID=A0AAX0RWD4_9BACI|nr:hypothetical protein CN689_27335 [Peribacillus butanolivorans]